MLAGVLGSAGGIASLISYPTLLAVGLPPLAANATNIVGLVAYLPGVAHGSRPELRGQGTWLRQWVPVTLVGGAIGAVLLLLTPPAAFTHVVPFLVAAGALGLLAAPWLSRNRVPGSHRPLTFGAYLTVLAVYCGYFGAGSGVMTLALIMILVQRHLPIANALKNILVSAANVPAAILLAIFAPVHWAAAAALAAGVLAGSRVGPSIMRAAPAAAARWLIGMLGLGLAVVLWVDPHL